MSERSFPAVSLDHQTLVEMLKPAFPDLENVQEWDLLHGGAVNTSYRFRVGENLFVLRIYTRDRSFCEMENALYRLIKDRVSIPQLIYCNCTYSPWAYAIFSYVPGVSISQLSEDQGDLISCQLGEQLAAIHSFTFSQAGLFGGGLTISHLFETGSSPYFEAAQDIFARDGMARKRLGPHFSDEILEFINDKRDVFPIVGDTICLVHSDFKPVNLLFDRVREKVYILDWEFAHAGMGILDFAILLRHQTQFPLNKRLLAETYVKNGGILMEKWQQVAFLTDFVNIAFLLEDGAERPLLFSELKQSLHFTMENWDLLCL